MASHVRYQPCQEREQAARNKAAQEKRQREQAATKKREQAKAAQQKAAQQKAAKMKAKFQIGQSITWIKSDSDVPEGTVGSIKSWKDDGLSASVTFFSGCWSFKFEELRISSKQPTVRF